MGWRQAKALETAWVINRRSAGLQISGVLGKRRGLSCGIWLTAVLLGGCGPDPWNDPYPAAERAGNILYGSFSETPKHLDPVRSYSSNEYAFIAQIYEPPLQYHFLQRPYRLVPLAADRMPVVHYYDAAGSPVPEGADQDAIHFSEYEISIRPGMRYQPHPAFAVDSQGRAAYRELSPKLVAGAHSLADFPAVGTREVTADDYIYEIKRLAVPQLHSPIAGLLGDYVVGFRDFAQQADAAYDRGRRSGGAPGGFIDLRNIPMAGVTRLDRYRFRVRLQGRYSQFVYWLAMPFFAPIPWEADAFYSQPGLAKRNISLDWYPVGSGPFMLTENNPNLRMVLERNPNFRGERYPSNGSPGDAEAGLLADAGQPLPFLDRVVYTLEKENIPYWNKFLQGYYDSSGVSSDSFDQALTFSAEGNAELSDAMREKRIQLRTAVSASIFYLGFNMRDPVVGGDGERARLLRRAIAIAVDFDEFISIFANGRGVPAQGPIPPGIFGNRSGVGDVDPYVYRVEGGRLVRRSLAEAKELLRRAGFPEGQDVSTGKPLVLYFDATATGPDDKARLNWYRKQFDKLGIQLVVRATDYNRFQEKMREGTEQIFLWGWNADYPDPENFFFLLYGPNGKVEHDGENAANYHNPELDALFDQMKNLADGPERQALIDQMLEIVRRDAPWVWGYHPLDLALHHSWVHNLKPNLMANNTLKYRRLDPLLRAQCRDAWNPPIVWPLWLGAVALSAGLIPAALAYRRQQRSTAR